MILYTIDETTGDQPIQFNATVDGTYVAQAQLEYNNGTLWIDHIHVAAEWRRLGVGSKLMQSIIDTFGRTEWLKLAVESYRDTARDPRGTRRPGDDILKAWYASFGFSPTRWNYMERPPLTGESGFTACSPLVPCRETPIQLFEAVRRKFKGKTRFQWDAEETGWRVAIRGQRIETLDNLRIWSFVEGWLEAAEAYKEIE
jgi:GNAT superfamily N-acetyltransferase